MFTQTLELNLVLLTSSHSLIILRCIQLFIHYTQSYPLHFLLYVIDHVSFCLVKNKFYATFFCNSSEKKCDKSCLKCDRIIINTPQVHILDKNSY